MEENLALKTCQKCKAKCCKLGGADLTKKEMQKIVNAGYSKNNFNKLGENHYEFKNIKGACIFLLKNNSCSIHNLRPPACKAWPITYPKYEGKKREFFVMHCPLTKCLSKEDLQKMKRQASKVTKEMTENNISKSKTSKKILDKCIKDYDKFKKTKF